MSSPDWSRSLFGAAETLAAICSGAYDPTHPEEGEELAVWLRGRLDAWQPTLDERRAALDEAARTYVVAALALWDAHGAPGMRP